MSHEYHGILKLPATWLFVQQLVQEINLAVTGGFSSQNASYVENISMSWHHHCGAGIIQWVVVVVGGGGGYHFKFKNAYELLNLRALKISMLQLRLSLYGQAILCGISKVLFEIP